MSEKVDTSREAVSTFLALSKDGWAKELVAALLAANESLTKDVERLRQQNEAFRNKYNNQCQALADVCNDLVVVTDDYNDLCKRLKDGHCATCGDPTFKYIHSNEKEVLQMSEKIEHREPSALLMSLVESPLKTKLMNILKELDSISGFGNAAFHHSHSLACRYVYEMIDNEAKAEPITDAALAASASAKERTP